MKTTAIAAAAGGAALLALGACGFSGPKEATGEITRLEEHPDGWIETDCVVDSDGPSCTADVEDDCYLVVFEDATYEYSDCIPKADWDKLKVGDTYTDGDDND